MPDKSGEIRYMMAPSMGMEPFYVKEEKIFQVKSIFAVVSCRLESDAIAATVFCETTYDKKLIPLESAITKAFKALERWHTQYLLRRIFVEPLTDTLTEGVKTHPIARELRGIRGEFWPYEKKFKVRLSKPFIPAEARLKASLAMENGSLNMEVIGFAKRITRLAEEQEYNSPLLRSFLLGVVNAGRASPVMTRRYNGIPGLV